MQKKKKWVIGLSVFGALAIATAVVSGAVCTSINQKQSTNPISNTNEVSSVTNNPTSMSSATTIKNRANGNVTRRTPNGKIAVMNATSAAKTNVIPSALFPSQVNYSSFNYTFTTNVNGSSTSYTFSYLPTSSATCTLLGFPVGSKNDPTNIVIPATVINGNNFYAVTSIASGAFYGQNLTSVTFNQGLLTIGSLAFANNNLTSLTFPSSLTSIGNKAFISNPFPHAYAVHVPLNATWNTNWLECPFGCKDDLGKLTNGIQFVIQGTAVYEFQPDQYAWVITSYDLTSSVGIGSSTKNATTTLNVPYVPYTPRTSSQFSPATDPQQTVGQIGVTDKYTIQPVNTTQNGWHFNTSVAPSTSKGYTNQMDSFNTIQNVMTTSDTTIDNFCIYTLYGIQSETIANQQQDGSQGTIGDANNQFSGAEDGWLFYFQDNGTKFDINTNGGETILGTNPNATLHISLYDPFTGKYIINDNISGESYYLNANDYNNNTYIYQYNCQPGDILSIYATSWGTNGSIIATQSKESWNVNIASNFNYNTWQADENNGDTNYQTSNGNGLNTYMDLYTSWTSWNGLDTNLAIKPQGLYSTLSVTTLSNVAYDPTNGTLSLSGNSLPNIKFDVQVNGDTIGTIESTDAGSIDSTLTNVAKTYTSANSLTLMPVGSTTTTSSVILPLPFTTHIQGNNPKESFIGIYFDDGWDTIDGNILANGITGKLAFTNQIKNYWPAYATGFGLYYSNTNNGQFPKTSNQNTKDTSIIDISYEEPTSSSFITVKPLTINANTTLIDVQNWFSNIPYVPGEKIAFWGSNAGVNNFFSNNQVYNYGYVTGANSYNDQTADDTYPFVINETNIVPLTSENASDTRFYAHTEEENSTNYVQWTATYGWADESPTGWWMNGEDSINWYNPDQAMVQVANEIAQAYSNPINKVIAVENWVMTNMEDLGELESRYQYTERQLFEAQEGVCGNYTDLTCTLLKLLGFVSRPVLGNYWPRATDSSLNTGAAVESSYHIWCQVWIPQYQEWISMDPLWEQWMYDNQIGGEQNYFTTNRDSCRIIGVMWPDEGTGQYYDTYGTLTYHNYEYDNYFSYFKGCEWQALNDMGRYYDVPPGMNVQDYDFGYANALTWLFNWAANPNNSINHNPTITSGGWSYNFESMGVSQY